MKKTSIDNNKNNQFELLKELLLYDDRQDLKNIKSKLDEHENVRERVSPLIDEKIEDLKENFPTYFGDEITKGIKLQIREAQDEVVEALYPIMGKLIKKYIVEEIAKLTEAVNKTINEKFSISKIIKRLFQGKRTDADDVMQEVFVPVIEEVFVIQEDSGLLVGNFSRGNIVDKDLVSGMLTAIKSFAEDAFSKQNQDLEDIKFETFKLSMYNFKSIYIAIAVSGVFHAEFKEQLSEDINTLAEVILRDRSYLEDRDRLEKLIDKIVIKENKTN